MIFLNNVFYFLPIIMVYFLFYFIVIRPGRMMEIRRYDAVDKINIGEKVILTCGLIGFVSKREGVLFYITLSEGFEICVLQNGIKDIIITDTKNTAIQKKEAMLIEHDENMAIML